MNDIDYPAIYIAANAASRDNQRNFLMALGGNLVSLFLAAALSLISIRAAWFCTLQAILLLIGVGLTIYLSTKAPQRFWYGTRALAESVKTVTWRFMMRAEPFEGDETEAHQHFVSSLRQIFRVNQKVSAQAVTMQDGIQITDSMLKNRRLSLEERKSLYKKRRISDQRKWYIRKAKDNDRSAKFWFRALVAVNFLAVFSALVRPIFPYIEYWPTDLLVVASGSMMAWLQTKRFQELAGSYTLTAHEIGLLCADLPSGPDEREFSVFVADSENAFSREHTQWLARRDAE